MRLGMVAARCSCGCVGTKNDHLQVRGQQWGSPDHTWTPLVGGGGAYIGSTSLALTGMGLGRADVELVEAKLVEGSWGRYAGVMMGISLLVLLQHTGSGFSLVLASSLSSLDA